MRRTGVLILVVGLLVAACGGDDDTSDTTQPGTTAPGGEATTTTAGEEEPAATTAPTTTEAGEPAAGAADTSVLTAECEEILAEFVKALEPVLDGRNPALLPEAEAEAIATEVEPIQQDFDAQADAAGCPSTDLRDDPEMVAAMLAVTEREAPGTLPMMQFIAQLAGYYDDVPDVSTGDCDTDLAALEALAAAGPKIDMTIEDFIDYRNLTFSVFTNCPERASELFQSPEFTAWESG